MLRVVVFILLSFIPAISGFCAVHDTIVRMKDCVPEPGFVYQEKISPAARSTMTVLSMIGFNDYEQIATYDSVKNKFVVPGKRFRKKYQVQIDTVSGRKVCYIFPSEKISGGKTIIYLHGGGYIGNLNKNYYSNIFKPILDSSKVTLIVPDYGLAPFYDYKAAYRMLDKLYQQIVAKQGSENLILMGESAGGGLALGFALWLKENGRSLPKSLILMSPWLDITMSNPEIPAIEDVILSVNPLKEAGLLWANGSDPTHYMLSPLNGNFQGLPPVYVFTGGKDMLYPDMLIFEKRMNGICQPVKMYFYPEMFHFWTIVSVFPESKDAMMRVNRIIRGL